jgi:hypothetical protein
MGGVTGDICEEVLRRLLMSIHMHGQHDDISVKLLTCITGVYELLIPQFPDHVHSVLAQVPGITLKQIQVCIAVNIFCVGVGL